MKNINRLFIGGVMIFCICTFSNAQLPSVIKDHEEFKNYWYSGLAEINRFELEVIQYGEVHDGDAIVIFVTEDFLAKKQVKLETPENGREVASVLKLVFNNEFITGIYKYSKLTTTFTPINVEKWPYSLKTSTTSQEWCGHTYDQLNLRGKKYHIEGHSYFEKKGDYKLSINAALLEDEIWSKLRISPDLLPIGEIDIIAGACNIRKTHEDWERKKATATKKIWVGERYKGNNLMAYSIEYHDGIRKLVIIYENTFPYSIAGWQETIMMKGEVVMDAYSVKTHTMRLPYWQKNKKTDEPLRKKLGLRY